MLINSVHFQTDGTNQIVRLRDTSAQSGYNTITVINGENGSGKSALLRIISDAALGLDKSRSKFFARAVKLEHDGNIGRVIALSGTHNDRFPLNSGTELRLNSNQFDLLPFHYFGPKLSGNLTSVSKASNTIAHSILAEEQHPFFPGRQLRLLLEFLKFHPWIEIEFDLGVRIKNKRGVEYFENLERHYRELKSQTRHPNKLSPSLEAAIRIAFELSSPQYSRPPKKDFLRIGLNITDDWQRSFRFLEAEFVSRIYSPETESIFQLLADLVSIGALTTKISFTRAEDGQIVRLDDLSSGEWQLLYTLMNLAIHCQPESLVLIDEPENSLHPRWQTEYIKLIKQLISHVDDCHVIVATHSPLIAASVMPSDGNLLSLSRIFGPDGRIFGEIEGNVYGWLPSDVLQERFDLESARPPEITQAINDALALLRISSEPTEALRSAAVKIREFKEFLPAHDPISAVLEAIVEIAFPDTAESVGEAD